MRVCATIAPGLAPVVRREARRLGIKPIDDGLDNAGFAAFEVDGPGQVVQALGRLRTVHRLGVQLASGRVEPADPWNELAGLVDAVEAKRWFSGGPFAVRGHRSGDHPFTSMDVAREVGGFLHDHLEAKLGERPEVDLDDPDAIVRVHLDDAGETRIWLDLAGQASLHRRGYRVYDHPAGMKASLACALLELADWQGEGAFADPMAGGGTLVVAAAWSALDVSPVHLRAEDLLAWHVPLLVDAMEEIGGQGPAEAGESPPLVLGDHAPNHVEGARLNLQAAGIADRVDTYVDDVESLPDHVEGAELVASNLPYGIRSGEDPLEATYERWIDAALEATAGDGRLGLMTPRTELVEALADERGLRLADRLEVQHGRLTIDLAVLER